MATNNSGPSFFDNAKEYAGNVASNAYNQTKDEFSRVGQNSRDRDWIVERESKLNNLTLSQKEQLKYISSADDATKFVEAATAGDKEGAEKLYSQALKSQGGAILSFAGDVATTALGGAAGKAAFKAAPKLFKGAAEVMGENIPSLKKYSNVFKSAADKADEALAAERAGRAAAREQRAQESIQRAQVEQQQARTARNSTQSSETPFRSNTTRATETVQETITPPPEQSIFGKVADWTKDKIGQGADWAGKKVVEGAKSVGSGIASLGKTTLKGAGLGAAIGIPAGEYYDSLSDEEKASWQEKAQKGVDWVDNAIDHPGEAWEDIKEGAGNLLGDAAGAALGATVGKGSNPFKGIGAGMGSLFAGGGSVGASLNSMPSGGDSGITGEGHFGGDNVQGTSAIEVLNKIYNILARTYDTVNLISRDVSTLTRSQSQQNAANDISFANSQARQNEGTATPVYSNGGSNRDEGSGEAEQGFWSKMLGKVNPKAAGAAAASALNPAKKARTLWNAGKNLVKKSFKPAVQIGSTVVAAELLKGDTPKFEGRELNAKQKENYKKIVEEAQKQGLSEEETDAALALAWHESNFKENVKGSEIQKGMHKGDRAHGIYQYMAKSSSGWDRDDPEQNIQHGVSDFKKHAGKYGIEGAYAAHQAGEGALNPDGTLKHNRSDGNQTTSQYQKQVSKIAQNLKEQRDKKVASAKPEINGTKLTGDTKRNPYFGQETTPFEENEEIDNSSQESNIPESMEAFRTELLEHKAKEEAAEKEYNKIKDESNDAPDHYQRLSDADYKLTNVRNSQAGILFDEKYKDSKDFIDEHDSSLKSYSNFINDPDYLKKKGFSTTTKTDTASPVKNDTTTKPDNGKSQVDLLNATVDQMNSTKYEMLDEDEATVRAKQQKFYSENPTATPVKNDDTEEQIAEIDRQKATLENERNEIGQSGVNVDKQTMDTQLDRLSDIHTEMSSLNEQRNNLSGGQPKQSSPKPASQQQAQQTPPPPAAPAGTTKSVPSVRNDDPTIKMMEEGSMWSTNGGLMA
jgi:hypothetical protein